MFNKHSKITVIGSLNMDLVVTAERHPEIGETLTGTDFSTVCGGKGGNQAVACAKLGDQVSFIGLVGDDYFGEIIHKEFKDLGINMANVEPVKGVPTGIASITNGDNDNSIIIVPGANAHVDRKMIDEYKDIILESDIVLTQLEIPIDTVDYIAEICGKNHIKLIMNPAPASKLTDNILDGCSYLTPNEIELAQLIMHHPDLMEKYKHKLIVTLGDKGSYFYDGDEKVHVEGYKAKVVDTTGAGDCFNGALASYLAKGHSMRESVDFANAAAAISVTKFGAQAGMPSLDSVKEKLNQ